MVCDNKLLRNIFINLLSNAMKFSPDNDKVLLFITRNDDETVDVVVQDDGIGIPEADLKRIFDPFTRGSNAGSITGTGLGLSIVKRAVETLQGKLLFESTIGKGTKVTVQLACSPDSV
jgi:signal transduction histidine kinase